MNSLLKEPKVSKEAIITVVGFLGAGKTTLLKMLISNYYKINWSPFVILNDYENAYLDVQQLNEYTDPKWVRGLSGSCICCSGIHELRNLVNNIPERENGITLIEANGTSDACSLMSFLGVGLDDRFLPPIQLSVIDVKNWQQRGEDNELEANQIQVSSLIVLTHLEEVSKKRKAKVIQEIEQINPTAEVIDLEEINAVLLPKLPSSNNNVKKLNHLKAHWSSCSSDLPQLPNEECIHSICDKIPKSILRVKGCTKIEGNEGYTYFERVPDGKIYIRPFKGVPTVGNKILIIGPGSSKEILNTAIKNSVQNWDSTLSI